MEFFILELAELCIYIGVWELDMTLVRCIMMVGQLTVVPFVDCMRTLFIDCGH
jgi:hypothetical protein